MHRPQQLFPAEPNLGAWYTEQEIEVATKAIRDSMDWRVGFGFIVDEILHFEQSFANYCGTEFAISPKYCECGTRSSYDQPQFGTRR